MKEYKRIIRHILENGSAKENRTGTATIAVAGCMFHHNMRNGFPLLTTKRMPLKTVAAELECFIKGITDKKEFQARNCHIWDEWCNPELVPYGHDDDTRRRMLEMNNLGPIYGYQWRHFNGEYGHMGNMFAYKGVDQLSNVVETLKKNPDDRRMIVSAWNPQQISQMALPPCHWGFQVTVINDRLNLLWNQRSVDSALGLPFNIASYALLLLLLAKESGFEPGELIGFLGDTHIYVNHFDGLAEQLQREEYMLPTVNITNFTSIFDWKYTDFELLGYECHDAISFDIAV